MQTARVPGKVAKGRYLRMRVLTRGPRPATAEESPGEKNKHIQHTTIAGTSK